MASVTLPATLFPPDAPADCKLQFVAFRTGSFFPLAGNSSNNGEHSRRRSVNTPVIFVGLGEEPLKETEHPKMLLERSSFILFPVRIKQTPDVLCGFSLPYQIFH